ncbi:cobyrinic acid a,c-diamide synthase [Albimonas donghaensis]|uniref:Hydrogenobyrinate a,c-diamide synthase n=1 Tax=Albimonas donghaensis TaxID=356660 RepID=A0A1H3BTI4_9RHOB|nr:cobyrinate a,c-diamide synthase [Albimonas donghaensis]SDX45342.1 cobyrinic acid a,c-diamide synthase [Albimonas donghaensis]
MLSPSGTPRPSAPTGLLIAAPSSGAGKTLVTLALLRALRRRGLAVAGAKSGPDYIDPRFHQAAAGRPSINLDAWAMPAGELRARAADHAAAQQARILVVEGAMGALDGAAPDGRGSAAELAEALALPVLLVIDAARSAQSAALPLAGLRALRPGLRIAGAVLNRTGSPRHADMAARAVEAAGFACFGALPRRDALALPSRHLGLVQAAEHPDLEAFLDAAAEALSAALDLPRLLAAAGPLAPPDPDEPPRRLPPPGARIALARDAAFAFAYPHQLADWRAQGAEIRPFSPLADEAPAPDADAVFLPGGYPELHAPRLAAADRFRAGMRAAAARGARVWGECGGYMTLGEGLIDAEGARHAMLGLLPLETSFAARRLTLGYRRLRAREGLGWPAASGERLSAHEFHYASILREGDAPRVFDATDAAAAPLPAMGLRVGRVAGSFAHLIGPGR